MNMEEYIIARLQKLEEDNKLLTAELAALKTGSAEAVTTLAKQKAEVFEDLKFILSQISTDHDDYLSLMCFTYDPEHKRVLELIEKYKEPNA